MGTSGAQYKPRRRALLVAAQGASGRPSPFVASPGRCDQTGNGDSSLAAARPRAPLFRRDPALRRPLPPVTARLSSARAEGQAPGAQGWELGREAGVFGRPRDCVVARLCYGQWCCFTLYPEVLSDPTALLYRLFLMVVVVRWLRASSEWATKGQQQEAGARNGSTAGVWFCGG